MTQNNLKAYSFFNTISAISAWTYSLGLISIYLQATSILGHFPSYNNPDPTTFSFYDTYEKVIMIVGNVWLVTFILWIVFTAILLNSHHKYLKSKAFILGLCGHLLVICVFFSSIMDWWAD